MTDKFDQHLESWRRDHSTVSASKLDLTQPGVVLIPLYRMRDLPQPFTISDEDRNARRTGR